METRTKFLSLSRSFRVCMCFNTRVIAPAHLHTQTHIHKQFALFCFAQTAVTQKFRARALRLIEKLNRSSLLNKLEVGFSSFSAVSAVHSHLCG